MRLLDWFRPGLNMKRWLLLIGIGVGCMTFGISFLIVQPHPQGIDTLLSALLILGGCVMAGIATKYISRTFHRALRSGGIKGSLDEDRLHGLLHEKQIMIKGPKIVVIGGGTGLSTMLRGLKVYSSNITAVVTVADDGGGSGILRQDLGILPPGDIRNCILALADTEPIMEKLLQYRFQDGMLKGQNFGNLFLAAMDGISSSFEEAVRKMSDVLAVTGRVLPVTLNDVTLCAELEDGFEICGESKISKHNNDHMGRIKRVFLKPENVTPLPEALDAIAEADIVVLGPGSLYTSIIPNLLVEGVSETILKSSALKVYVCNIMTQPGESDHYSVYEHIQAIEAHAKKGIIEYCIVNNEGIPEELKSKYKEEGAEIVRIDNEQIAQEGIKLIQGNFLSLKNNLVRHDPKKLAETIIDLVAETVLEKDKKREIDYYYIQNRKKQAIEN